MPKSKYSMPKRMMSKRMGPKRKPKKMGMGKKGGMKGKKGRCWTGYKPTPGKKPFTKGSCMKK